MKYHLVFLQQIIDDVREGTHWYDQHQAGLGNKFIAAYDEALDRLMINPLGYAADDRGYRHCRLLRFPYIIHFRTYGNKILIVAMMAGCRDTTAWRQRT